ncbi:MAG TPA: SBBP repeat-containing protein [Acidimicrobiales bacterium]|nr:SBBP repeat-containing protein [Acidimicrobiales bacterium]
MRARVTAALAAVLVGGAIGLQAIAAGSGGPDPRPAAGEDGKPRVERSRLPVSFVANRGRWDPRASWVASGPEASAYFVQGALRWALAPVEEGRPGWALDQALVGARQDRPAASVAAEGRVSYLTGDTHHSALPTATELTLAQAWPGVDVTWSGAGGHIEATYRLAPGADPSQVEVAWRGADALALTDGGRLAVTTPVRTFEEGIPKAYQEVEGRRVPVDVDFELRGRDSYGFRLGSYDPARPLVIDPPVLLYSSFLGGDSADVGEDIAVDGQGNAYVTGWTASTAAGFPETVGVFQPQNAGDRDAFVAKVNPSGTALVYATFLGGVRTDEGRGIEVDGTGNAYVGGVTSSTAATFPETPGAFQPENAGGSFDAFAAKLDPTGSSLLYATFLGGNAADVGYDIGLDPSGNAYVTGETRSSAATFPETPGALQTELAGPGFDAFVAKLNPTGTGLVYATYLGGAGEVDRGTGIDADAAGNAYLTGRTTSTAATFPETPGAFQPENTGGPVDAFVAKVNPGGTALVYASFLGGSAVDAGNDIAVDGAGSAFVTGSTESTSNTYPETAGVFQPELRGKADAFVAKVNPAGTALDYNTYLGGTGDDVGFGIAVDANGNAHVGGQTLSTSATFPDTPGWFQPENNGFLDGFVAKVNPTATALVHAGFFGGDRGDYIHGIATDASGASYVTGLTTSPAATFPQTRGVFQPEIADNFGLGDAFVAKISAGDVGPTPTTNTTTPSTTVTTTSTSTSSSTTTTPTSDVYCGRFLATIVGTPGNDFIFGTQGRDVIKGLGGEDTIYGLDGNDVLCGDDGADTIRGSSGDDVVRGNDGNDTLEGDGQNDYVTGDLGDDIVRGGDDDDRLVGAEGNDELAGGGENDFLGGGDGNDALNGGRGDDRLEGNVGDDRLVGNDGADTLLGQEGRDRLNARDTGGLTDTLDGGPELDVCSSDPTDVPPSLNDQDC